MCFLVRQSPLLWVLSAYLAACTPPLPEHWVELRTPDAGLPIPQKVDSGLGLDDSGQVAFFLPDSGEVPQLPKIERAARNVLLLDLSGRRSANWTHLSAQLAEHEHSVTIRTSPPQFSSEDLEGPYGKVIVAAGTAPEDASFSLHETAVRQLSNFVRSGGHLLILMHHGYEDSLRGRSARAQFNAIFDSLQLDVHIQTNTLVGDVYTPLSGHIPHHVTLPWSYVTPFEPLIGLPVGFPAEHLRPIDGVNAIALGWTSSIACDDADVEVLLESHSDIFVQTNVRLGDPLAVAGQALPVAIHASRTHGTVTVVPRSLMEFSMHSLQGGDQPVLEPNVLIGTRAMSEVLIRNWLQGPLSDEERVHNGCRTRDFLRPPRDEMSQDSRPPSPHEDDLPPLVPPPEWMIEQRPSAPVTPSPLEWVAGSKIRLISGRLEPRDRAIEIFQRLQVADFDAFAAYVPAQSLIDFGGDDEWSQRIRDTGQLARNADISVFLTAHYLNENYRQINAVVETTVDARGRRINAPSPVSEIWWETQFSPLILGSARASNLAGIQGLIVDMKLHNSGLMSYDDHHGYDDQSWSIVVARIDAYDDLWAEDAAGVPQNSRRAWLINHGLLRFALTALEDEVALRAAHLLRLARQINPDYEVHLSVPNISTSWFYRGLYRGFGTATAPVILLSYEHQSAPLQRFLNAQGYPVLTVDGISAGRLSSDDLLSSLGNAASGSAGYWLSTLSDITEIGVGQSSPAEYWDRLQRLNQRPEIATPNMD